MRVSIGQDSHRFETQKTDKKCIMGGVAFDTAPAFEANSDGDVVIHAVVNAVSGITCRNILGKRADEMCQAGITDSREYLKEAMKDMAECGFRPVHLSITIEGKRPAISPKVEEMRISLGEQMGMSANCVGITATTGEGLTDFGRGLGVSVFCILTAEEIGE